MNANILVQLIAKQINPEHFQYTNEVVWLMETKVPPVGDEVSPYNTEANRAIVADIIKNYDTLAAQYELEQKPILERNAYKSEADPIYIEWQALLATEHPEAEARRLEWMAKRAEIKSRFK